MNGQPVNALIVGSLNQVQCSLHGGFVDADLIVHMHGGRGYSPKKTCIPCMERSIKAWKETECPFCVATAERVESAIAGFVETGHTFSLPAVPTEEIPAHRKGCPWEGEVLKDD